MVGIEIAQGVRETSTDSASAIKVKQVLRQCVTPRALNIVSPISHTVTFVIGQMLSRQSVATCSALFLLNM